MRPQGIKIGFHDGYFFKWFMPDLNSYEFMRIRYQALEDVRRLSEWKK